MGEGLDVCDTRLMLPFMAARLALVSDASGHPRTCARCWPHVAAYLRDHHGDARESMGPVACPVLPRCYHSCYHVPAKWGHPGAIRSYQKEFAFVWLISGIHWISAAFHHSWPILYGEECIPTHGAEGKITKLEMFELSMCCTCPLCHLGQDCHRCCYRDPSESQLTEGPKRFPWQPFGIVLLGHCGVRMSELFTDETR